MKTMNEARPDLLSESGLKEWIVDPEDELLRTGAVYRWDSGYMGYSYWLCMAKPDGEPVAVELLPDQMEPREKDVGTVQEKGEYVGQLHETVYETAVALWHAKWEDD